MYLSLFFFYSGKNLSKDSQASKANTSPGISMYLGTSPPNNSSTRNYKCKICNEEVKYFKSHLKITHKMTQKEYNSLFSEGAETSIGSEINVEEVSKPIAKDCKLCNEKVKYSKTHLKNVHKITEKEYDMMISQPGPSGMQNSSKNKDLVANDNRACKVCNEEVKNFKLHLKDAHEMTEKDYDLIFMEETQTSSIEDNKNKQNERKSDESKEKDASRTSRSTRSLSRKPKKNDIKKSEPVTTTEVIDSETTVNEDELIKENNIEDISETIKKKNSRKPKKNDVKNSAPVTNTEVIDSEVIVNKDEHIKENTIEGISENVPKKNSQKSKKNNIKKSGPVTTNEVIDSEVIVNEDEHIKENNIETFPKKNSRKLKKNDVKKSAPVTATEVIDSEVIMNEDDHAKEKSIEDIVETFPPRKFPLSEDELDEMKKDMPASQQNEVPEIDPDETQLLPADNRDETIFETPNLEEIQNHSKDVSDKIESIDNDIIDENNIIKSGAVTTTLVIDSEETVNEDDHTKEINMEDISDKTELNKKYITDENNLSQFGTVTPSQSKTQKFAFKFSSAFSQKAVVAEKSNQDTKLVDSQEKKSQDKKSKFRISFLKSGRLVPSTERKSAEEFPIISSQANFERKRRYSSGMG